MVGIGGGSVAPLSLLMFNVKLLEFVEGRFIFNYFVQGDTVN